MEKERKWISNMLKVFCRKKAKVFKVILKNDKDRKRQREIKQSYLWFQSKVIKKPNLNFSPYDKSKFFAIFRLLSESLSSSWNANWWGKQASPPLSAHAFRTWKLLSRFFFTLGKHEKQKEKKTKNNQIKYRKMCRKSSKCVKQFDESRIVANFWVFRRYMKSGISSTWYTCTYIHIYRYIVNAQDLWQTLN